MAERTSRPEPEIVASTPMPGQERRIVLVRDGFALLSLILGLLLGIAWLAPGGGQITGALNSALATALGKAGILLPLLLVLAGLVVLVRAVAPSWRPPAVRLVGLLIVLAMVPVGLRLADVIAAGGAGADAQGGGFVGRLLSDALVGLFGVVGATAAVVLVVIAGLLIFVRVTPMQVVRGTAWVAGASRRRTPPVAKPRPERGQPAPQRVETRPMDAPVASPGARTSPVDEPPPTRPISPTSVAEWGAPAPEARPDQSEPRSSLDLRPQRNGSVVAHGLQYPPTPGEARPIETGGSAHEVAESTEPGEDDAADFDPELYERAVELAEKVGRVSVSLLQRRLGIGAGRAQALMKRLIDEGHAEA